MKRSESIKTYNRPASVEGLPESPELERAVLGALILEPDQLPDVVEIVEISAFHDENNGKIYGAMLSMLERGDKIDLYTLSQRPELKDRDMLRYFSELTSAVGSGVNVLDHAGSSQTPKPGGVYAFSATNSRHALCRIPTALWIGLHRR